MGLASRLSKMGLASRLSKMGLLSRGECTVHFSTLPFDRLKVNSAQGRLCSK